MLEAHDTEIRRELAAARVASSRRISVSCTSSIAASSASSIFTSNYLE